MLECPRCHRPVSAKQSNCPICGETLKVFGHPGMPLYRSAAGEGFLCDTCTYHADDSCTFPQRPQAVSCTLYRDSRAVRFTASEVKSRYRAQLGWGERRYLWLGLGAILVLSLVLTLSR